MPTPAVPVQVNRRRFDRLVHRAVMSLPADFRRRLDNIVVAVQDRPSRRLLEEVGADDLLGIYIGVPLTERSSGDLFQMPDRIMIFQRPLEEICRSDAEIVEQVRITVVHEVGHYFGLDDEEIEAVLGP